MVDLHDSGADFREGHSRRICRSSPSKTQRALAAPFGCGEAALRVVYDPDPAEIDARVDWSQWYVTDEEDEGQGLEQNFIIRVLLSCIEELARERGWKRTLVGSDQFFAWVEKEPLVRVSPDVYLLDDPPEKYPSSWQVWLPGHKPPRFAVEVVSAESARKDYVEAPLKYAQLGARELVIFDPEIAQGVVGGEDRRAITVYRREEDGGFVRVYGGDGPAWISELEAWVVVRREGSHAFLRISRDAAGKDLVPTKEEARQAAEAELARLRAELGRLKGERPE